MVVDQLTNNIVTIYCIYINGTLCIENITTRQLTHDVGGINELPDPHCAVIGGSCQVFVVTGEGTR